MKRNWPHSAVFKQPLEPTSPPAAHESWTGVRDAVAPGNRCPQFDTDGAAVGNEDCLTLNVYAVNPPASSKQPVIVFIHGGGNVLGSAQDMPWGATPALAGHDVIVVTVENRLGLLGFLVNPLLTAESAQGSSGNYGLMDLVAALQWVRDNITEFGGDPARVMIDGHSARRPMWNTCWQSPTREPSMERRPIS